MPCLCEREVRSCSTNKSCKSNTKVSAHTNRLVGTFLVKSESDKHAHVATSHQAWHTLGCLFISECLIFGIKTRGRHFYFWHQILDQTGESFKRKGLFKKDFLKKKKKQKHHKFKKRMIESHILGFWMVTLSLYVRCEEL